MDTIKQRVDSWVNALTGIGDPIKDKLRRIAVQQHGPKLLIPDLDQLYSSDDIAARIVDLIPDEAMRQGYALNAVHEDKDLESDETSDLVSEIIDRATELDLDATLKQAWVWGRLYGVGAVLVGAEDGLEPHEPLDEERVSEVKFLNLIERSDLTVNTRYTDPFSAKYDKPLTYYVTFGSSRVKVHESRLIVFEGVKVSKRKRDQNQGFNYSVLERVYATLQEYHTAWKSAAHLMSDMSQGVVKIKGLMDIMSGGQGQVLMDRVELMNMSRSVSRVMLLDSEEDFERKATPTAGVADILDRASTRLSAGTGYPAMILMGEDPAGLAASGDAQVRRFYDTVANDQSTLLGPKLTKILSLIARTIDPKISVQIKFNSLWQLSETEKAEIRSKTATSDQVEIASGVLLPEEVALARHTERGYDATGAVKIDRELRQEILDTERDRINLVPSNPEPTT